MEGPELNATESENFWRKVAVAGIDECWPWTGSANRWGYGDARIGGRRSNASRVAYVLATGDSAEGLSVCHRCDNPICCNPAHLFAAPQAVNLADCRRKGRARGHFRAGAEHPRANAKLTEQMVREIRARHAAGETQTALGAEFGIHSSGVSRLVRGEQWGAIK